MTPKKTDYDSIIFDLDGTLWDSTAQCAEAWNDVLRKLKVSDKIITSKDIEKIMGMTLEQCFATTFPEKDEATRKKLAKECFEREIEIISKVGAMLFPGVKSGLISLSKHYPLYIVSNCSPSYLSTFFNVTQLKSLFQDFECYGNTGNPKFENIKSVVERNGLKKTIYIGDTASDEEAAHLAQVDFAHAAYGFGTPRRPSLKFETFSHVVSYFIRVE